jgi:hypothetical protein
MSQNGKLKLKLIDETGKLLGEAVELDLSHRMLNDRRIRRVKASRSIIVSGLHTDPGTYLLEVHPTSFEPQGQIVEILPEGITDVVITFQRQAQPAFAAQAPVSGKVIEKIPSQPVTTQPVTIQPATPTKPVTPSQPVAPTPPSPSLRTQVLAVAGVADVALQDLRERDLALYKRLEVRAAVERKSFVLASFEKSSQALLDRLGTIDYSLGDQPQRLLKDIILAGLQAPPALDSKLIEEANARLAELERSGPLNDPAAAGRPLKANPLFQKDLQNAEVFSLAGVAGLADAKTETLLTRAGSLADLRDETLKKLVEEKAFTAAEAGTLGLSASLYRIADGQLKIAEALSSSKKVTRPQDLVALDNAAWEDVVQRSGVEPPAGLDRRAYAARLRRKVVNLFPTDALLQGKPPLRKPDLVVRVAQANPKAELLTLDLSAGSADLASLRFPDGLSADDQKAVLSDLKSSQRAYALTGDIDSARTLLASGLHSAQGVASLPLATFQQKTGLPTDQAQKIHEDAQAKVTALTLAAGAVVDIVRGGFKDLQVSNISLDMDEYLKKIAGFAELFGSQNFCHCEHCQSILGPAAYFVDLMRFVEKNVLDVVFHDQPAHLLNLKVRRPDLWTLPLTCENTETLVPYLDLINEILESYIAQRRGYTGDLGDRAAVEDHVYRLQLAAAEDSSWQPSSFRQPFVLPVEQLDAYLAAREHSRAEVARALMSDPPALLAALLRTSRREVDLIVQKNEDPTFLRKLYGLEGAIDALDAQLLLPATGLSRADLGNALATRFVQGATTIEIRSEKKDADSVQNDIERIYGLTMGALDRLHRFTRLLRRLPWSIAELDLALGAGDLIALPTMLALQERWKLSVAENCALWSAIPQIPPGKSLFDRLFNLPPFAQLDGPLPKDSVRFVHPAFRTSGTPLPADHTLSRLLAGLRVDDDGLAQLIRQLTKPLGAEPDNPDDTKKGFLLTAANLTLLYRHARLAEWLKLTVAELFQLIRQAGLNGQVADRTDLEKLLDHHDAWKESGFKLDDIDFITRVPVREPSAYPDAQRLADEIVQELKDKKTLELADTVFAFLSGVTEEQSRLIVKGNPQAVVPLPDGSAYRLIAGFSPTTSLKVAAELDTTVREVLLQYHASQVLPLQLGRRLALPVDKTAALLKLTGADLSGADLAKALQGDGPTGKLTELIDKLLPLTLLFRHPIFDPATLDWVNAQKAIFAIADFNALSVETIRKVALYTAFAAADEADPVALRQALTGFGVTKKIAGVDAAGTLADALQADTTLVHTLQTNVSVPSNSLEALTLLSRCAALARDLGVDGETLKLIVSDNYGDLLRASRAVLSTLRSRAADEADYLARLEPFEDRIRSHKRDALVDFLIHSIGDLKTPNELYEYFLIDVQLEGCARTSRLVAAISSVQLYVHRCLMNLEEDRRTDPAQHIHVSPTLIPPDQWVWRKSYRVWEANRKVFLYPENYLEPELRDDKSPLFRELEDRLLQQQINEETVLDAYAAYLSGFEEVARLKIAGSYHDVGTDSDVLHLFGVTPGDPPTYYYRAVENAIFSETAGRGIVWSPWRKIDVQIPVRKVSPITYQGRLLAFWVEIVTSPKSRVEAGFSIFEGYKHRLILKYTTLRLDGTWAPPQTISLKDSFFFPEGDGVVVDPVVATGPRKLLYNPDSSDRRDHTKPADGYTLAGASWDRVYPAIDSEGQLTITFRNFRITGNLDFYRGSIPGAGSAGFIPRSSPALQVLCSKTTSETGFWTLFYGAQTSFLYDDYAQCTIVATEDTLGYVLTTEDRYSLVPQLQAGLFQQPIAAIPPLWARSEAVSIINGAVTDAILDINGDLLLLEGSARPGPQYLLKRLGTTLRDRLSRTLFTRGVDGLLNLKTQTDLKEDRLPIFPIAWIEDKSNTGKLDFQGPYGTYFREIFFHIPFLIANQLNSRQSFAAAQRWYHYVFDPTAVEDPQPTPLTDRVWRYLEFRHLDVPRLRALLTDTAAQEVYRKDPFNPHAIARLRPSAYQKNVVMKYIDNLLDWGDSLFTQFTTESINEATLLYVLAADILGPRPAELGSCGEGGLSPKTYEKIKPALQEGSEFLIEIETMLAISGGAAVSRGKERIGGGLVLDLATVGFFDRSISTAASSDLARPYDWKGTRFSSWTTEKGETVGQLAHDSPLIRDLAPLHGFAEGLLSQMAGSAERSPVFCVPENQELSQSWDRVEDRLYKIRHCLDITGARRQFALFAPEIDPRLLVRARAAGLSIEDVLNATSGNLPPYRFTYLIEKARQYTATVQSFGTALLSAVEKRDAEELNRLRSIHQQNLLRLTTRMRELEINAAQDAITTLERQQAAIEYRKGHYQALVDGSLNTAERIQQVSRHAATALRFSEATLGFLAGALHLVPETGSPFAMKYGGIATGSSVLDFAIATGNLANLAENVSTSAGLEAGFQRREEDWKHQVQLADHDLKQLEKQLTAAQFRKEIAERSLTLHQATLSQEEEIFEFYKDRFTNLGLYTWLATNLQRLYREAYNSAYAMARLAEQAFRFERGDDTSLLLQPDSWDASKAGLLAGDRLLLDLQNLERRFVETNYRSLEIDQSFSLAQIDPAALVNLREKGECAFTLSEVFFDLFYPGQYRRRIRSVRLTLPCVTGPYTNVGATLTLNGSRMRPQPKLGAGVLQEVPRRRSVSIASSKAQNDSGVFEFSFRDERYMPFEGAGAVSDWSLTLPKSFRPFDYQTISDVILHVSYTAEEDGDFRRKVEELNEGMEGTILNILSNQSLKRAFSLRQDFSTAFNRLLHSAAGTAVPIAITDKHLPLFLRGKNLQVESASLVLRTRENQTVNGVAFTFNTSDQQGFSALPRLGGLRASDLKPALAAGLLKEHSLKVMTAGDLAPAAQPGDPSALDAGKLLDVLLYVEFRVVS